MVWVHSGGDEAVTSYAGCSSPADEAGTDSVTIADVSGTVEDGASCSDEATDHDRRSVVVTGTVKAAGAYRGGGVGSPVRALSEKLRGWPADESNTSCDAVADCGVKPERRGVNCSTCSKPDEIAPWETLC